MGDHGRLKPWSLVRSAPVTIEITASPPHGRPWPTPEASHKSSSKLSSKVSLGVTSATGHMSWPVL